MNKYVNPPCKSSLAMSCAKSVMASCCGEGKMAALFTKGVSGSAEGELALDETVSTVSPAPNICVLPGVSVAAREGEECAAVEFVRAGETDDNDSFVDIISGITAVSDAESEGWIFANALARAN